MKIRITIIVLISSLFSACNITKELPAGDYLLAKNSVKIEYPDSISRQYKVTPSDLNRFIPLSQVPNKRLLKTNFFLWIHSLSDTAKNNGFNRFLRRVGEAPVIYDLSAANKIKYEMGLYMDANGYYNSELNDTVIFKDRRAFVSYNVTADKPYTISSVRYTFKDESLEPIILADTIHSLIKVGDPLSRLKMSEESSRIAAKLENMGYYQFSTSNISYSIDTLGTPYRAKVEILIDGISRNGEVESNKIYRIRNIYVNTNYKHMVGVDTTQYDTISAGVLNFIYARGTKRNLHPNVMARVITLYPNLIYSRDEIEYTSSNIQNLKFFKSVNILFNEIEGTEDDFVTYVTSSSDSISGIATPEGYIDCTILCAPIKKQNYQADFEVSTNDNYTGTALTIGYGNRNLFKHAEQININATGAYDFMRNVSSRDSYEFGFGGSLSLPWLAVPKLFNKYRRNLLSTSTTFDLTYSSQRRTDYDKTIIYGSFGYSWISNNYFNYSFKPLNVGILKVPWISDDFLDGIENPYLINSYMSQMIFGTLSSFRYSTQSSQRQNTVNLRANVETSGNLLNLISRTLNSTKEESDTYEYYKAFGIQYSQYVRSDIDFTFTHNLNSKKSTSIVYRFYGGGGYSYGNSASMPYERLFYVGGSNSMRGWQIRTLGPGETEEPDADAYPSQVGNIKFEANIESRFSIWGPLNGAVFLDAGNIWYNGLGEDDSAARFEWDSFYKELGLNTGIGARLDFGYFVLRLDWGIQLHNPGWSAGERWIHNFDLQNTALHFGIGYPF
ncbi:MAG: BamA/TamA family outer membrane protein [Rikenellaceae bacterium]